MRPLGFYWVKWHGSWIVAEYRGGPGAWTWELPGSDEGAPESDFEEIGPRCERTERSKREIEELGQ